MKGCWNYLKINGHNFKDISKALRKAQYSKKPIAIYCKPTIGYGSPNKNGKAYSHGSPLGENELNMVRKKYQEIKLLDYTRAQKFQMVIIPGGKATQPMHVILV